MRFLTTMNPAEERAIRAYHADTEYVAEEADNRPQPPSATREEVNREIDYSLLVSVMVGAPC